MKTISDIVFDCSVYPLAKFWSLLLYDMTGISIVIPLPNAYLMRFLHPFTDTTVCQKHIDDNDQKNITLFTYEDNMNWLIINSYFENTSQLEKINIFCSSIDNQDYWTGRTERFRNKIEKPFLYNELDIELLLFGHKHTQKIYKELYEKQGSVSNKVKEDARNIMQALAIYFQHKVNTEDEQIRLSEEANEGVLE
ncbi:hypothetical protein I4U23_031347 [Adineta vaga]|nr:hypothetical protein I4U23_031347 [Adineta vaga]